MSDFTDMLKADAATVFADVEKFGEEIVYRPRSGADRTFSVVPDRSPPAPIGGAGHYTPSLVVFVPNSTDATKGVASIDKDGDKIVIAEREGGTAREHLIAEIVSQDPGGWTLRLR